MDFLTLFAILLACTVWVSATEDSQPERYEHAYEIGPFKSLRQVQERLAPRQFTGNDSPSDKDCAFNCTSVICEGYRREMPDYQYPSASQLYTEFDREVLKKICPWFDSAKACLETCQTSQTKSLLQKTLNLYHYHCHDEALKSKSQCLKEAYNQTITHTCDSQSKCGPFAAKLVQYESACPTTDEGLKDFTKQTCLYAKCSLDCALPIASERCGPETKAILKTLAAKHGEFLKNDFGLGVTSVSSTYPRECDRLMAP